MVMMMMMMSRLVSYVRPLLQLQTATSVMMIRSDEQFSFQTATERGLKVAAT